MLREIKETKIFRKYCQAAQAKCGNMETPFEVGLRIFLCLTPLFLFCASGKKLIFCVIARDKNGIKK